MTDKHTTEYLEKLGSITLSSDSKVRIREELSSFADFHTATGTDAIASNSMWNTLFVLVTRPMTAVLVLLVLIGTSGISFVMQQNVAPRNVAYKLENAVDQETQPTGGNTAVESPISYQASADTQEVFAPQTASRAKMSNTVQAPEMAVMSQPGDTQTSSTFNIKHAEDRIEELKISLANNSDISSEAKVEFITRLELGAKFVADAHALASTSSQTVMVKMQIGDFLSKGIEIINAVSQELGVSNPL